LKVDGKNKNGRRGVDDGHGREDTEEKRVRMEKRDEESRFKAV
jgi:hypothetical protein